MKRKLNDLSNNQIGLIITTLFVIGLIIGTSLSGNSDLEKENEDLIIIIKSLNYENKILDGANDILANSVKEYYELATSQDEILMAYADISKISLDRYKASQDDLLKERDELYSCWSNTQTLDSILRLKYNWDGVLN